jgi:hypothetical protein
MSVPTFDIFRGSNISEAVWVKMVRRFGFRYCADAGMRRIEPWAVLYFRLSREQSRGYG